MKTITFKKRNIHFNLYQLQSDQVTQLHTVFIHQISQAISQMLFLFKCIAHTHLGN